MRVINGIPVAIASGAQGSTQGVEHFFGLRPRQPALAFFHLVERNEGIIDRQ